jgi:predicted HAD superfamily phosphohydrolase YqeG
MILGARNAKRPWSPEHDKQLREMVEAGKSVTTITLRLKRTVLAVSRLGILSISVRRINDDSKNPPV